MSTHEESGSPDSQRGFAGLTSLLSNPAAVEAGVLPQRPAEVTQNALAAHGNDNSGSTNASSVKLDPPPPLEASSSKRFWLILGCVVIGGAILAGIQNPQSTSPVASGAPTGAEWQPVPTATNEVPSTATQPTAYGTPPSPGTGQVLNDAEIRYCTAQSIRIDGAKELVSFTSNDEVERFNALVNDFNGRCASFRYRRGALERARADVEPFRGSLRIEGLRLVSDVQQEPAPAAQTAEPTPGLVEGPVEAEGGSATAAGEQPCGGLSGRNYERCLADLTAKRAGTGKANAGVAEASRLSQEEQESLEASCSTDKYVNGPAAYKACLKRQTAAIPASAGRPDLSALDPEELVSIEASCGTDKYVNGPASYNRCLRRNLATLAKAPRRPDLSALTGSERDSIESACGTDKYVNGPAAYNKCLTSQLKRLRRGA